MGRFGYKMPVLINQRNLEKMTGNVDNNEFSLKNFDKTFFHPNPGFYKISIDYEQNATILWLYYSYLATFSSDLSTIASK